MKHLSKYKLKGVRTVLLTMAVLTLCPCAIAYNICNFNEDEIVNLDDFALLSEFWEHTLPWAPDGPYPQMISHWRLDLDATDSQSSHDGIVYGNPIWVTGGQANIGSGAIYMDGQDYIEINATDYPDFTASITIDAWVKLDNSDQDLTIISKGQNAWQLGIEGQSKRPFFSCSGLEGTSYITGANSLNNGFWYHIAGVYDQAEGKIYLYLDGTMAAQSNASGTIDTSEHDIWIGGNPDQESSPCWWYGYIDNVRVYNYALGDNEIFNSKTIHVDTKTGSNGNNGQGRQNAFKTISYAISEADSGDKILVWPGTYNESIIFDGKAITIKSASDAAILTSPGGYAASFYFGEQSDSVLENFVIKNSLVAVSVSHSSPTLRNLTIVNNSYGIDLWGTSLPQINSNILWGNTISDIFWEAFSPEVTYSCIERLLPGQGNIDENPLLADPNSGDFHLRSEFGRYVPSQEGGKEKPASWSIDEDSSPCIDAGVETLNPMCEPMPNGGRVNIGAYAETSYASKSPWPIQTDIDFDGQVSMNDLKLFFDNWLTEEP